jgi:hypothetical protein
LTREVDLEVLLEKVLCVFIVLENTGHILAVFELFVSHHVESLEYNPKQVTILEILKATRTRIGYS